MVIERFPPIESANEDGLLGLGGDLEVKSLLLAYRQGIFPWPLSPFHPVAWFSPNPRGVLCYKDLHISHSLKKILKKEFFTVTFNQEFNKVIMNCAFSPHRKNQKGEKSNETWITNDLAMAYIEMHYAGHAYSVEVWNQKKELVGGLYGVSIDNFFSGESMFFIEPNASKVALVTLMQHLHKKGIDWIDTQMATPLLKSMGAKEIPRKEFITWLKSATAQSSQTTYF